METVIRGAAIYFILLIALRLSGRRTVAQMTPFDLVLLLIIAETTQQALLGDDFSIINAALLIIVLFSMDIGLSYIKKWAPRVARIIDGTPTVLISDGKPDLRAFARARVSLDDVLTTARVEQGLEQLTQIKSAVLEADGAVSIIPKE
ncbi:uncharacterized membrane protein YcaP (DUF421 family) [Neorhizobium huautlense]|uniref:Uncharacterized membrane protein YcaP (DUF421 family) n=1 Tax=Neorhizobium huautlense TaxID=67774 RepID=A0ABT9Q2H3_9HYPH|nr:YetF domain-containing protein [Neorhizobium huautlense]MDP9840513.1 uncharacterized membrane protein YcaP (DUF421 family) [Neorhizobium huautlense]